MCIRDSPDSGRLVQQVLVHFQAQKIPAEDDNSEIQIQPDHGGRHKGHRHSSETGFLHMREWCPHIHCQIRQSDSATYFFRCRKAPAGTRDHGRETRSWQMCIRDSSGFEADGRRNSLSRGALYSPQVGRRDGTKYCGHRRRKTCLVYRHSGNISTQGN